MGANVYEIVNQRIIELLEAGSIPWRKPWATSTGMPRNIVSKKEYRGINVFLLACQQYGSAYWLTYRQAEEKGGNVRKGEKATKVVFWKMIDRKEDEAESEASGKAHLLRFYNVFNLEQCEGITPPTEEAPTYQFTPIEKAEQIMTGMKDCPEIIYGSNRASYTPVADRVRMPNRNLFEKSEAFFSVLYHELAHSTGHQSRLGRKEVMETVEFGSESYGSEELCAELCSSYLCAVAGISNETMELSASYIENWLKAIKKDKRMLVIAAARAQAAADHILGRTFGAEEMA